MNTDCAWLLFLYITLLEVYFKRIRFLSQGSGKVLFRSPCFKDRNKMKLVSSHCGPFLNAESQLTLDLSMCNLCEQSLNCCCSIAASPFPSQTVWVCVEIRELILAEKKQCKKGIEYSAAKVGSHCWAGKMYKMKRRRSFCSPFLLCITLGLILHLYRSTANFQILHWKKLAWHISQIHSH